MPISSITSLRWSSKRPPRSRQRSAGKPPRYSNRRSNRLDRTLSDRRRTGIGRGDPGAALLRVEAGEDTDLAGDQKAQRIDRLPDPPGIGYHRDALQLPRVVDANVEVVPSGAGKS